jgi:hypothetical protein
MRYLYLIFAITLGLSLVGCSAQRGEYVVEGNGRLRKLSDKEALIATFKSKVHMTAYYEKRGDRPIHAGAPSGAPPRRWPRCSCSLSYFNSSRLISRYSTVWPTGSSLRCSSCGCSRFRSDYARWRASEGGRRHSLVKEIRSIALEGEVASAMMAHAGLTRRIQLIPEESRAHVYT